MITRPTGRSIDPLVEDQPTLGMAFPPHEADQPLPERRHDDPPEAIPVGCQQDEPEDDDKEMRDDEMGDDKMGDDDVVEEINDEVDEEIEEAEEEVADDEELVDEEQSDDMEANDDEVVD